MTQGHSVAPRGHPGVDGRVTWCGRRHRRQRREGHPRDISTERACREGHPWDVERREGHLRDVAGVARGALATWTSAGSPGHADLVAAALFRLVDRRVR